jgi:hypothetical protein
MRRFRGMVGLGYACHRSIPQMEFRNFLGEVVSRDTYCPLPRQCDPSEREGQAIKRRRVVFVIALSLARPQPQPFPTRMT